MRKLRVMALMHQDLVPPDDVEHADLAEVEWKTEFDVVSTLRDLGHEVMAVGVRDDLSVIDKLVTDWKPHIAFNLLEEFTSSKYELAQRIETFGSLLGDDVFQFDQVTALAGGKAIDD